MSHKSGEEKAKPQPPIKKKNEAMKPQTKDTNRQPGGLKGWLIRLINRAIKRLSKFR